MDPTNGKLHRSQQSPLNVMETDSVKRAYISIWGIKVSICGIRLKEKSEDNISFVGSESHIYTFMGDYFPLKGNNSPLIGITFVRNFSL